MARKRTSLAAVAMEEQLAETTVEPIKADLSVAVTEKKENQTIEQVKVSLTVDSKTFMRLNEISLKRRMQKQPHGISEIIRNAVDHWLQNDNAA